MGQMRDDRIKNKPCPPNPQPKPVRKELSPDIKKALDIVEEEVRKEKKR